MSEHLNLDERLRVPYSIGTGISKGGDAEIEGYLQSLRTQGFCVVERVIPEDQVDAVRENVHRGRELLQQDREAERRNDKRPTLSDLRESGALEQDADCVLLLFREELYKPTPENRGVVEIIIAKQRSGPVGKVTCHFDPQLTRFRDFPASQRSRTEMAQA